METITPVRRWSGHQENQDFSQWTTTQISLLKKNIRQRQRNGAREEGREGDRCGCGTGAVCLPPRLTTAGSVLFTRRYPHLNTEAASS